MVVAFCRYYMAKPRTCALIAVTSTPFQPLISKALTAPEGEVTYVYRNADGQIEHVLVNSDDRNVFMVLVLDRHGQSVVGHCLLNLPVLYGLAGDGQSNSI